MTHSEEKLKSLSERLRFLARDKNAYSRYVNQEIKSENLQFNLSLVISHIIINLHFKERSKNVFEEIITEYNNTNKTTLTFGDFENLRWVRIVAGEVLMPALVSHFVWKVSHYEKEGKPIEIPLDKNDLIRCLQLYSRKCFEDSKLTITKTALEKILSDHASKNVTIEFLIERDIIGIDSKSELYYWKESEYLRHLRNEIASTLWLLVGHAEATDIEFRNYFKLIKGSGIWVDDLRSYLGYKNTLKICELAVLLLNTENDLLKSNDEFSKIWLDAENYRHIDINAEIPIVEFNYETAYDFIESVNYHKWRFHDAFDYQRTRSFCHSLIRIIICNDPNHPIPYENVLKILKDTSRPFLLWTLYQDIPRSFPYVIPYLLSDHELIPIAFKLIDKVEFDYELLSEQSSHDKKTVASFGDRNQFWLKMFDFTLEQIASLNSREQGELIAKVLLDIAEKIFKINYGNRNSVINHNSLRKRYDEALKKLAEKRIINGTTYSKQPINPRLILLISPGIVDYIKKHNSKQTSYHTEFLNLKSGTIDLSIELLRLANLRFAESEISEQQIENIKNASTDLVSLLHGSISQFYSKTEIDVQVYNRVGLEKKKVKRGISEFGFEIIDWGYLFLHFEKVGSLQSLNDGFIASLDFKTDTEKYDEQNREQSEKIKLYLKSLMLAFISINQKRDLYEIDGLPVKQVLDKLENWIRDLALTNSIDAIPEKRIDVFNEIFSTVGYDIYHQPLITLLYRCINYLKSADQTKFVEEFFSKSIDVGRMLTGVNILDSNELRDKISKRINEVKIEDFIASSFTTTELQNALVEAVNSDDHWELAKPLIERIRNHFERIKHYDENTTNLLFEINLLLAFKEKDFDQLTNLSIPTKENYYPSGDKKAENVKIFFVAIYKLYNDKNFREAIQILKSLLSEDAKNIRYAFHLYRAETLNAIQTSMKLTLLAQANLDWENFFSRLSNEEKHGLSELGESIDSNSLHYYVATKDSLRFDQTLNKLSNRYLYDEEILPTVYTFYVERGLHELAFDYIKKAEEYFSKSGIAIPTAIQMLLDNSETSHLLSKLKLSFEKILTLKPKNIASITPEIINDKRELNLFVLHEIILALKVLLDKIHSIKQISHEDRFNDLLLAILRLRVPIWGWTIQDQPRLGSSPTSVNAGEVDILVQAAGQNIAFIEALILESGNSSKTEEHILKCFNYVGYLNSYYILVYFRGPLANFDATWTAYKSNVLTIPFPSLVAIDKTHGFEDISDKFEDIRHLKIAKTIHGKDIEMFHMMIDLSE